MATSLGARVLFPYQEQAIKTMQHIESTFTKQSKILLDEYDGIRVTLMGRAGVLADPTGSGKTTTMLSLIKAADDLSICSPDIGAHNVITRSHGAFFDEVVEVDAVKAIGALNTNIVVLSPNLVEQWKEETLTIFGAPPLVINTQKHVKDFFAQALCPRRSARITKVILLNENRFKLFGMLADINLVKFSRIVFDEARHSKHIYLNMSTSPPVGFTWFISASTSDNVCATEIFADISNHGACSGMMSSLSSLPPHIMNAITVRTPIASIEYPGSIEHVHYECRTVSRVADIAIDLLPPELSSRLSAGDVPGALAALGGLEENDIISVAVHRIDREIRAVQFNLTEAHEAVRMANTPQNRARVTELQAKEANLLEKKKTMQERFDSLLTTGTCPICIDVFEDPVMLSCCGNVYCGPCLITYQAQAAKKCPMCRSREFMIHRVSLSGSKATDATFEKPKPAPQPPTKHELLKELLQADHAMRSVVYSEHENILTFLKDISIELQFDLCVLEGQQSSRGATLKTFKSSQKKTVLFANAITDCAGLDLPEATDIILWHRMPAAREHQIISRTRRVSTAADSHTLVHHLYC